MSKVKYSKDVSVIIPTFNNEESLEFAIRSVAKSSYPIFELIVVDDGSKTKYSKFIIESLKKEIKFSLLYKRKKNGGPSSARNVGINIARGDWIAFLDADDLMITSSIESKFQHLEQCKNSKKIAGIYGSFIWSTTKLVQPFNENIEPISRDHIGVMGKVPGGAPSYIFKKNALKSIGGFDEKLIYNEDFDLLLRLIKSGYQLVGTNKPGFVRNIQENSLTRASVPLSLKGGRLFLKKAYRERLLGKYEIFKRLLINYLITIKDFYKKMFVTQSKKENRKDYEKNSS